ncbi:uncharacterized protein [Solanum lycopersicum]|uniref:uncharacterized protein n=1 Tax=Solanum lycopersicum TaxID=4081 RepID=UPI00374A5885
MGINDDDLNQNIVAQVDAHGQLLPDDPVQKKEDPGAFTNPCTIGLLHFAKALCDLGAIINLMPFTIYKKLGLGDPNPIAMRILMADRTILLFLIEVDFEVLIILGKPLLATSRALVDMEKGQMKFWLNNEEVTFNICTSMRQSGELQSVALFSGKLKSKWTGPYLITQLFPHGAVELETKEGVRFNVNRELIKIYSMHAKSANEVIEERTLTDTPSGSATQEEGASGSLGVSWSKEASKSVEVSAPATDALSTSSDEADNPDSTPGLPTRVPAPVSDKPSR